MVTSLLISLPIPFLYEHSRLLYDAAGSICRGIFVHGLFFLLVSGQTWAQPPNNSSLVDCVAITVPKPQRELAEPAFGNQPST